MKGIILRNTPSSDHSWLAGWMQAHEIALWGTADLRDFATPKDANGHLNITRGTTVVFVHRCVPMGEKF